MQKKLIILSSLLLILSGCKKEEIECPEPEEEVLIKYNGEEITEQEVIKEAQDHIFPVLFEKIKGNILKEEMKDHLEDGEDYVKETIKELETYYGNELEEAIKQNTTYTTIEEYEEALLINYLEDEYVKQYICKKENIEYEEITDDNKFEYYHKHYVKSLKDLFKKYDIEFKDKDYEKMYKEYIKEIEDYYNEQ